MPMSRMSKFVAKIRSLLLGDVIGSCYDVILCSSDILLVYYVNLGWLLIDGGQEALQG